MVEVEEKNSKLDHPVHPGKYLLQEIEKLGISQKELSIRTGVSDKHISTLISGTRDISTSFGRKLEYIFNSKQGYWSKLQAEYDRYIIQLNEKEEIQPEEVSIVLKNLKEITGGFVKENKINLDCSDSEKVIQYRNLLQISDLTLIPNSVSNNTAFRAQLKSNTNIDPYVVYAWQRLCEIIIENKNLNVETIFNKNKLIKIIPKIKQVMFENDITEIVKNLTNIFLKCGISFAVVHHFKGAPIQGFIKQSKDNGIILCLTFRGKFADRFWFSLFHEIGHLVNDDIHNKFVDFDSIRKDKEEKADIFARDTLIPEKPYKEFLMTDEYANIKAIEKFAQSINVPAWVVIGRLHKDEWLGWEHFANKIPTYNYID